MTEPVMAATITRFAEGSCVFFPLPAIRLSHKTHDKLGDQSNHGTICPAAGKIIDKAANTGGKSPINRPQQEAGKDPEYIAETDLRFCSPIRGEFLC